MIHFTDVINRRALTKRSLIPSHVLVPCTIAAATEPAGINDRLHEDIHTSHNADLYIGIRTLLCYSTGSHRIETRYMFAL